MHPKEISIKDYSYTLTDERIAKHPLGNRDESKLLVYQDGLIQSDTFKNIDRFLPEESLLVFNNTKVIHARLLFNRETGAEIEILCLEPYGTHDPAFALNSKITSMWKAMVGNAKRWKQGEKLIREIPIPGGSIKLTALMLNKLDDAYIIGFFWEPLDMTFGEVLQHAGLLPLPPYLNRENIPEDEDRYQTIYASEKGSVAAPTAGLHFSGEVFDRLQAKQIQIADVTLHVGAGTFKPVKADVLKNHEMHEESVMISLDTLKLLHQYKKEKRPVGAVGTTVSRTLESLYWHGVKLLRQPDLHDLEISQWECYELDSNEIPVETALAKVIENMEASGKTQLTGTTKIIIVPGYAFKMVDILVTNFHQPENTLILLVAAFVGDDWKKIYQYALDHDYRFLSYGDSSVLFRVK